MSQFSPSYLLYFDGACSLNPGGIASFGWQLLRSDRSVLSEGWGLAEVGPAATCNSAEYAALVDGLEECVALLPRGSSLLIRGDSELVIRTLAQRWRLQAPNLLPYRDYAIQLLHRHSFTWRAEWIPREENAVADCLSRRSRRFSLVRIAR